jgi:hypothetical protein
VTGVNVSGGTTGLTTSGGPVTTSGTITLAGTLGTANGGTNLTSFTSSGVVYASSSSVLATGSALTFDGTTFVLNNGSIRANNTGGYYTNLTATGLTNSGTTMDFDSVSSYLFKIATAEQMRLTTTGLGIGTSTPAAKLEVFNSAVTGTFVPSTASTWRVAQIRNDGTATAGSAAGIAFVGRTDVNPAGIAAIQATTGGGVVSLSFMYVNSNATTEGMRLDSSGNLGVGTTAPDIFANSFERNLGVFISGAGTTSAINVSGGAASRIQFGVGTTRYGIIYQDASNFMQIGTTTALPISFNTNNTQRFMFGASGQFGIGATPDYGTAGQVLTSGGSGAAPTWAAAGGGSQAFVAFGTTGESVFASQGF